MYVQTHKALGTLWTYPGSTHTAPNAKCTGNVNSDAAHHGICLLKGVWGRIFLIDTAVTGHFPTDAQCLGIFLLDAAVSGHFVRIMGVRR